MTVVFRCGLEGDGTYLRWISKYTYIVPGIVICIRSLSQSTESLIP